MANIVVNETQTAAGELVRVAAVMSSAPPPTMTFLSQPQDEITTAVVRDIGLTTASPPTPFGIQHSGPPPTCSVVWRIEAQQHVLAQLLAEWERLVLSPLGLAHRRVVYEWVENGTLGQLVYQNFAEAVTAVPADLASKQSNDADLQFLLNVVGTVIEIVYDNSDHSGSTLLTASLVQVPLPGFAKFFTSTHASYNVRTNGEIAARLFNRDAAVIASPLDILNPLPLV